MSNSKKKENRFNILILLGLLLIAAALCLTAYNFIDAQRAGDAALETVDELKTEIAENPGVAEGETYVPSYMLDSNHSLLETGLDGRYYIGVLTVPALGLELPVQSTWSYPNLRISPCRYAGSPYTKDLIIAAHNYPRHFGNLKTLYAGDAATFTDLEGNVFHYQLMGIEILDPYALDTMLMADFDMTLFTCTIGGQTRVTCRFRQVDDVPMAP